MFGDIPGKVLRTSRDRSTARPRGGGGSASAQSVRVLRGSKPAPVRTQPQHRVGSEGGEWGKAGIKSKNRKTDPHFALRPRAEPDLLAPIVRPQPNDRCGEADLAMVDLAHHLYALGRVVLLGVRNMLCGERLEDLERIRQREVRGRMVLWVVGPWRRRGRVVDPEGARDEMPGGVGVEEGQDI